ncbi:hypothetical protein Bca4012_063525 [Brassica carinata]
MTTTATMDPEERNDGSRQREEDTPEASITGKDEVISNTETGMAKAFQLLAVLTPGSTVEVHLLRFWEARGGEPGCRHATPQH